jgi:hypothetical protein
MGFFNKLFKRNVEGIVAPNQYYNPTTDDYEVIQGSNGAAQVSLAGSNGTKANVDASGSLQVKIAGADDTSSGALNVNLANTGIILPVDSQARYGQTIPTHSGVIVTPSGSNANASWIDCNGFSDIAITLSNSGATPTRVNIYWSHDGATLQGIDVSALPSASNQYRAANIPIKARYAKLEVVNENASPATISTWTYLKA